MSATRHTMLRSFLPAALLALGMAPLVLMGSAAASPEFSARYATPQSVGASAITAASPVLLNPGVSNTLCFTANITSPDAEYTDRVDVDLPDGWAIGTVAANSAPVANGCSGALPPVSGTAAGNVVFWQAAGSLPSSCGAWNGGSAGTNFQFCVAVTPPDCSGAPWNIPWNIIGDSWGSAPHSASGTYAALDCGAPPPAPDIDVSPASLASTQATNATTNQTLTIANNGTAALNWTIDEEPMPRNPVVLALPGADGTAAVTAAVALELDDGTTENGVGIGGASQFVFLNRFTPSAATFPITLNEVQVYFDTSGLVNVGDNMLLVLYENTTGGTDPAPGSNLLASHAVTVTTLDAWNSYILPTPVTFNGPGDVLVGVVALETPGTSYWPAAIDQTASQQRSWAGWWTTSTAPIPPTLPPDDTWILIDSAGLAGNWMIRGYGQGADPACVAPANVPWLSLSPTSGTTPASGSTPVTVTFDSTGLTVGSYTANLCVNSDDPTPGPGNGTDLVVVPVSLTVTAPVTHVVTSSVGTPSGTITPLGAQTVVAGATATFTLAANAGHHIDNVGGTCGGTLTGTSYTTNAVSADCTVIANFAPDAIPVSTVVPGGHGTVSGPATVPYGSTATYTLTPDPGYGIGSVTGCGGTLLGNVYTTGPITAACTITVNFVMLAGPTPTLVPANGWQMLLLMMGLLLGGAFITLRRSH